MGFWEFEIECFADEQDKVVTDLHKESEYSEVEEK